MGARKNGRVRGRHARGEGTPSPLACLLLARPFFLAPTYFLAPATQAITDTTRILQSVAFLWK